MHIKNLFNTGKRIFSFEFYPPKNYLTAVKFGINAGQLMRLNPSFVSITYGAGGSSRDHTFELVDFFQNELKFTCMAHYTVVGATREKIAYDMRTLKDMGIKNVMLLRGDPPKGTMVFEKNADGFDHASDLISYVRKNFNFCIGAGAYPEKHVEASSMEEDINNLWKKVDAGADFFITQMFFDNQYYWSFLNQIEKKGITCKVIPGIIPITSYEQIKRLAEISNANIPSEIKNILETVHNDPVKVYQSGLEIAKKQSVALLDKGAPGIHVFTLNKSRAAIELYEHLPDEFK